MRLTTGDAVFKEMYPFKSNYFDLDGNRMHYVDEGARNGRPTLVMLHGNPSWSFLYRNLISDLRKDYRVIAPDHIGMGLSDKPQKYPYTLQLHINNISKLLSHLLADDEEVILLMHDWGGAIGCGWAINNSARVKKMVVFNTAAFLSKRIPFRINICKLPIFGALSIRGFNAFAGAAVHMAVENKMKPEVAAGFVMPYDNWHNRISTLRFVQDIPMNPGHPSFETLYDIDLRLSILANKPVLVQWGGKDWCFNDSFYNEWLRRFPDMQADYYSDAGHYVLEDALGRILPRVREFIAI